MRVEPLDRAGIDAAQALVAARHYLQKPVDTRSSVEGYGVYLDREQVGVLLLGRPQASACYPWYGSVDDVDTGRAECSRWSVLNLARVWFSPLVQPGGVLHVASHLPGFVDRGGEFRSTVGSAAIAALADQVVTDYLMRRPPCFLDEPYELRWLLSYCDTRRHVGTLYRASGFELYRTNEDGVQTWRLPLRPLARAEHSAIAFASWTSPRSNAHRARRAQRSLLSEVA